MMIEAFQPNGASTVSLAVTAASGSVNLPPRSTAGGEVVRVHNSGTVDVFMEYNAAATTTASMPIGPNTIEIFSLPPSVTSISGITISGSATLYFTIGRGV